MGQPALIIIVAGVAGSGKTTVGSLLASRLGWEFVDGDSFHPAVNIAKMHAGIPLTDADRGPWLAAIEAWMDQRIAAGASGVVACSALHRAYRSALAAGRPGVRLVFLMISQETGAARLAARRGHFFPWRLLDSQFRDLEPPAADEPVLVVAAERAPADLATEIISRLGLAAA